MTNATISGIKGVIGKPDSMPGKAKDAMMQGLPKRVAMSTTLSKGRNAMPKVK